MNSADKLICCWGEIDKNIISKFYILLKDENTTKYNKAMQGRLRVQGSVLQFKIGLLKWIKVLLSSDHHSNSKLYPPPEPPIKPLR